MAAFQITVTQAGRIALVNASNTGTDALVISQVGVSTVHYAGALASLTLLPNELKRISTIGGQVVAADTLHVAIRDETADAYAMRAFGLYLNDGTLFAVYSQAAPLIDKSAAAVMVLANDVIISALGAVAINVGNLALSNPPASETVKGVVELASAEETATGTDATRAIHPAGLKATLLAWAANFAAAVHSHPISQIVGLSDALNTLTTAVNGKAAAAHQHAAADITTGVFADARIPSLALAKITGLVDALAGKSATGHKHAAADIVSGVLDPERFLSAIPYSDPFTPGLIEKSSQLQAIEGVGDSAAITPVSLWAALRSSPRSMAASGYLKIPGTDLILQWGQRVTTIGEGDLTITYPTSFPNACVLLAGQINNPASNATLELFVQGRGAPGLSSGVLRINQNGSSPSASRLDWWALGY